MSLKRALLKLDSPDGNTDLQLVQAAKGIYNFLADGFYNFKYEHCSRYCNPH